MLVAVYQLHEPPGSWCWVPSSPRRHLLLVGWLGGGGLGQEARCPHGLGVMGFVAHGWSPGSGTERASPGERGNPAGAGALCKCLQLEVFCGLETSLFPKSPFLPQGTPWLRALAVSTHTSL